MDEHHHRDEEKGDVEEPDVATASVDDDDVGTQGMIPGRRRRRSWVERISMRILATGGIIGLDVALGAILTANHVHGWIVGLVVGVVSVVLAAILWSSRQL
jgi:protein-S-isoprenylcysteine O-methyltransferase Ste14